MTGMITEYVEIGDMKSLDEMIATLQAVRDALPAGAVDMQVRARGDDFFGRHVAVSYRRPKAQHEHDSDARCVAFAAAWGREPELRAAA